MMRAAAVLLLAGLAQAGTEVFEAEKDLWPNGVEYSLEAPAAEAHLLLAFKSGLCTRGERGTTALASALFVVEYNDADRQTCYWNRYRPFPFDADANPEWYGDDGAPGLFITDGDAAGMTERVIVLRFPRVNRWRVRVTPLYGDDAYVRRGATLVQVAELRDSKARPFEELDPLPVPEEEVEVPAEAEESEPLPEEPVVEEPSEEAVAWTEVEGVGEATVRTIRAGVVPKGDGCRPKPARRRAPGNDARAAARLNARPWWQPPVALQPAPQPIAMPKPTGGAPVAGTVPPWGAPLPFWAVPKPRPKPAPARAPCAPPTAEPRAP